MATTINQSKPLEKTRQQPNLEKQATIRLAAGVSWKSFSQNYFCFPVLTMCLHTRHQYRFILVQDFNSDFPPKPVETENKICEGWELGEEESLSRGGRSSIQSSGQYTRAEGACTINTRERCRVKVWGTMGPQQTKTQVAQRVETIPNSGEESYLHISNAMLANIIKCLCWLRFIEIVNIFIVHFKR